MRSMGKLYRASLTIKKPIHIKEFLVWNRCLVGNDMEWEYCSIPTRYATAPNVSAVDLLTEFADISGRRTATRLGAFATDFTDAKLIPPLSPCQKENSMKSRASPKNLILWHVMLLNINTTCESNIYTVAINYLSLFSIKCRRNQVYLLHYY